MKNNPHYAPENLMDMLVRVLRVKNDRQLAARFGVLPSQVCKIRKRLAPISAAFLINMHEETGLSLVVLRALMGDFREHTGRSAKHPAAPPPERLQELQRLHDLHRQPYMPLAARRSSAHLGHANAAN
ncbi:hypothetical protein [Massilia orientalis]